MIKPIDGKLLEENLYKVAEGARRKIPNNLLIRCKSTLHSIRFNEILYLESAGHVVTVHTRTEDYNCYGCLEKMYERLPEYFIQCHKSYVVNMNGIRKMDKSQVMMEDNTRIPISKARYRTTKDRYDCYAEQILLTL